MLESAQYGSSQAVLAVGICRVSEQQRQRRFESEAEEKQCGCSDEDALRDEAVFQSDERCVDVEGEERQSRVGIAVVQASKAGTAQEREAGEGRISRQECDCGGRIEGLPGVFEPAKCTDHGAREADEGEEGETGHATEHCEPRKLCGKEEPEETRPGNAQGILEIENEKRQEQTGDDDANKGESAFSEEGDAVDDQGSFLPETARDHLIAREFSHHLPGMARLNNGSYGSCPRTVLEVQASWSQRWLEQPDKFYFGPLEEGLLVARTEIARLIHAPVEEVVVLENVTAAASMIALDVMWAFAEGRFQQGDSILMLNCAYGAVKKAFKAYATRAGANIFEVTVPFPVSSSEQILQTFEETLVREKHNNPTQQIRLAVFDHIVSMPTMILPISKLVKLCRSYGVEQIFIDGAHGIGNLNLDMQEIGADYYMSNVHKWMFAPSTAAFLHCQPQHLSRLHHPIVSHNYGSGLAAECAWMGTRDYSAVLSIPAAIQFVKTFAKDIEAYSIYNHKQVVAMAKMLASAWGTHLGTPPELCAAMAMVGLPPSINIHSQVDALHMRRRLRQEFKLEVYVYYAGTLNLETGAVTVCDIQLGSQSDIVAYVRISHQIYNRPEEYHALRDAILSIAQEGMLLH